MTLHYAKRKTVLQAKSLTEGSLKRLKELQAAEYTDARYKDGPILQSQIEEVENRLLLIERALQELKD